MRYAPLYIHSFVLCAPRKILEATQFNRQYRRYEEIENIPDRLRWCRHSRGLLQTEVANRIGMTHNVYRTIEEGITQYIQKEFAERLAQLYGVPITHFIDEYNQFLYDGQAKRIRAYRKSLKLGIKPFSRKYGIPLTSLRHWEKGLKTISRASWERYFKGKA